MRPDDIARGANQVLPLRPTPKMKVTLTIRTASIPISPSWYGPTRTSVSRCTLERPVWADNADHGDLPRGLSWGYGE